MAQIVLNTLLLYVLLVVGLNTVGRRVLGQLNQADVVVIAVLGSAIETAMIAGDTSLPAGLVSATTLLLTNYVCGRLARRYRRIRRLLTGEPVLLISEGRVLHDNLEKVGLAVDDLLQGLRRRGYASMVPVRFAMFEADGEIDAVPWEDPERDA